MGMGSTVQQAGTTAANAMSGMTHYMQLLSENQPWNLILFMAIPVIFAEFIAITELYILFTRNYASVWRRLNGIASIIVGFYFTGVFVYLFTNAVIPLTTQGGWRGLADVVAVGFYLAGIVPLGGIALVELRTWLSGKEASASMKVHAAFVAVFLVVAHVAMIFGMVDPRLLA
ncbi:MAG TPA: DUF6803 family protein [Chloroflexota bacterium]|nr:DUF6803 family protein [Chloroflexota bacterium]